jgi:hypothetical protein
MIVLMLAMTRELAQRTSEPFFEPLRIQRCHSR